MLRWETPEFEYKEKNSDWYWILGIVAVIGALISILFSNVLFAIFILISAFVIAIFASKYPDTLHVELNHKGVVINELFYPYRSIDNFWVEDLTKGIDKLFITPKGTFALQIVIPIQNIDSDLVREFMADYCEEEEQSETIAERIMEYFHF